MSGKLKNISSLMASLDEMSDDELLKWLAAHPVSGGEHNDEDDDDDDDDGEDEDGEDELDDDGNPTGKKGKSKQSSKPTGKLYTKQELDDIVEKSVTERLARERRSKDRNSQKDKGEYETLAADLQKEIDEEWKPKVEAAATLESRIEELEGVVNEQVESILSNLPQDLADLDLGEEEDPIKRLNWLITKVVPKSTKRKNADGDKKGNPPSPAPKDKQGRDIPKPIQAPVTRRRF